MASVLQKYLRPEYSHSVHGGVSSLLAAVSGGGGRGGYTGVHAPWWCSLCVEFLWVGMLHVGVVHGGADVHVDELGPGHRKAHLPKHSL